MLSNRVTSCGSSVGTLPGRPFFPPASGVTPLVLFLGFSILAFMRLLSFCIQHALFMKRRLHTSWAIPTFSCRTEAGKSVWVRPFPTVSREPSPHTAVDSARRAEVMIGDTHAFFGENRTSPENGFRLGFWGEAEQVPCFCKWLMLRRLEMKKTGIFDKSNRSRTGHFGVKNGFSEKGVKIEQVIFECWIL